MPREGITIAVDPGRSTGVAVLDKKSDVLAGQDGFITATLDFPEELWSLLREIDPENVVCEAFATGGRISADGLHTVRLVGGVQALSFVMGWKCHTKLPVTRKAFIPVAEQWLKHNRPNNHTKHEVDALAHLLAWEAINKNG